MALFRYFLFAVFMQTTAQSQTRAEKLDTLFSRLQMADEASAKPLQRELDLALSQSESPTTNLLMTRAAHALQRGEPDLALYMLETVGKQEPKFAESYVRLAIHHEMNGDSIGAVIELEKALQAEPRHIHALAQLGNLMMKLENEQAAFKAFDHALKLNPHFAQIKPIHEKLSLKVQGQGL